jgi:hypothetical protein
VDTKRNYYKKEVWRALSASTNRVQAVYSFPSCEKNNSKPESICPQNIAEQQLTPTLKSFGCFHFLIDRLDVKLEKRN